MILFKTKTDPVAYRGITSYRSSKADNKSKNLRKHLFQNKKVLLRYQKGKIELEAFIYTLILSFSMKVA